MMRSRSCFPARSVLFFFLALAPIYASGGEAEFLVLRPDNYDDAAPKGKEADAIYGDLVIRNDQISCVIGNPIASRNANMTVRGVGGAIIDLGSRKWGNDQLSAFYPLGARFRFTDPSSIRVLADGQRVEGAVEDGKAAGKMVTVVLTSASGPAGLTAEVRYTLHSKTNYIAVSTKVENPTDNAAAFALTDSLRADRSFTPASLPQDSLFTATDEWFRQCYAIIAPDHEVRHRGGRTMVVNYKPKDGSATMIPPGESIRWTRRILPASNIFRARGLAARMQGTKVKPVKLEIVDPNGPVNAAKVTLKADGKALGSARTSRTGTIQFPTAASKLTVEVEAVGRPKVSKSIDVAESVKIELEACGYLQGKINGEDGKGVPCKVAIFAKEGGGGETPYYGPDSAATAVQNLRYAASGRFKVELAPGDYEVIVSRGPEYDVQITTITVTQNETTRLDAIMRRVVNTQGWVSTDYHSHSTPSGDNTSLQLGRVQNLICEHVEFAPCTEHNRISSYAPHLDRLKAHRWMATCIGMELTGGPLPVNHQNAFPLKIKPRTQDYGAPLTDGNPVVQIERLAMWDNGSEKLVQANHPNLPQILGDRDLNGEFDGGFKDMFQYMDAIEVHPPIGIFNPPEPAPIKKLPRNPMFHWIQMLNLGYRIAGVVNTDAHYNFHGSGWIRNYVKSSTDEPAEIDTMEMVRASKAGRVVMTTGPFMEVKATSGDKSAGPGEDLAYQETVKLHVKVQCANWLDVNRVQVFVNGRPSKEHNYTRRTHPEMFADGVVKFDQTIEAKLEKDAHIIVATVGEGLTLGRVAGPRFGKQAPVAVANPIFIDVDGGGFKPNGDLLDLPIPVK